MRDSRPGSPIVLIPGLQGRWEWMAPAVEALGAEYRVLTCSLEELGDADAPERAFERWYEGLDATLDRAGVRQAVVAGVSFGGLVAAGYAAARPHRVSGLLLISTPAPQWRDNHPSAAYLRHPRLSVPQFVSGAVGRLLPEVRAAIATWPGRARFFARHLGRILRFPASPTRMAARVRAWSATDLVAACRRITAPTLVITGDADLDRVVPIADSLEYVALIHGARHEVFAGTGHIGLITRPREFAAIVSAFVRELRPVASSAAVNEAG
ncbi:MAG: alpha/beta fold hydrolase [Vicinamibacterales bacterium]